MVARTSSLAVRALGVLLLLPAFAASCAESAGGEQPQPADADALAEISGLPGDVKVFARRPGLCLDLGCGDGKLAAEIAKKTAYTVFAIASTHEDCQAARENLNKEGLYGTRVRVVESALRNPPLPKGYGNLIVSGACRDLDLKLVLHLLNPNGMAVVGGGKTDANALKASLELAGIKDYRLGGNFAVFQGKMPEGSDDWTHTSHGPDNICTSRETVVRPPFRTQWLLNPVSREAKQVCHMTAGSGRVVYRATGYPPKGEKRFPDCIYAWDAFNGTLLWERKTKFKNDSYFALVDGIYYSPEGGAICALDAATGVQKKNYPAPQSGTWLWMAVNQGRLYGQVHVAPKAAGEAPSAVLCAMDLKSGEAVWTYESKTPLCLWFTCLGGGTVFACALEEKGKGFLLAVDAASGKELWRTPIAFKTASGAFSPEQRVFTTAGYYRGKYYVWTTGKGASAYDAKTGELAQEFPGAYSGGPAGGVDMTAPLFVGDKMYFTAGKAYKCVDLSTGNVIENGNGMAKAGCGPGSASMTNLYSGGQGFSVVDLASGRKWNGTIPCRSPCVEGPRPANGLLYVMPSHCGCPYLMTGPIALAPAGENWLPPDADKDLPARVCAGPALDCALGGDGKIEGARIAPNAPKNSTPTAPVFGGGMGFVGSRTGIVYGADGATGELRWTFCCGGAIRRPPAYARGRLLVGSDDGWVYGLDAKTGRLAWRFRAAPEERYFNMQGELTSAWPVRTGIVVDNETAYCGAGLFPFEGAYLYALDVKSGKPAWARRIGDQDHPDAIPQADLIVSGDKLQLSAVPSLGRKSLPIFYRKSDGERVK